MACALHTQLRHSWHRGSLDDAKKVELLDSCRVCCISRGKDNEIEQLKKVCVVQLRKRIRRRAVGVLECQCMRFFNNLVDLSRSLMSEEMMFLRQSHLSYSSRKVFASTLHWSFPAISCTR